MNHRRMLAVSLVLALLPVGALVAGGGFGHGFVFHARLTGAEEVPPVVTDTSGRAFFRVNEARTKIRFDLRIRDGVDIIDGPGAHIHCGDFGTNGPVAAFLAGSLPLGWTGDVRIQATLDDDNVMSTACGDTISELVDSMIAGETYVNVHSVVNPGGEVRGQIAFRGSGDGDDEDDD